MPSHRSSETFTHNSQVKECRTTRNFFASEAESILHRFLVLHFRDEWIIEIVNRLLSVTNLHRQMRVNLTLRLLCRALIVSTSTAAIDSQLH